MRQILSVLCNRVLIDQITQNVSLIDLVDSLAGPITENTDQAFPLPLDFLTVWERNDVTQSETGRARLSVKNARGEILQTPLVYDVDLTEVVRARNLTRFPVFPCKGVGVHHIEVEYENTDGGWVHAGSWPVLISALAQAQAAAN